MDRRNAHTNPLPSSYPVPQLTYSSTHPPTHSHSPPPPHSLTHSQNWRKVRYGRAVRVMRVRFPGQTRCQVVDPLQYQQNLRRFRDHDQVKDEQAARRLESLSSSSAGGGAAVTPLMRQDPTTTTTTTLPATLTTTAEPGMPLEATSSPSQSTQRPPPLVQELQDWMQQARLTSLELELEEGAEAVSLLARHRQRRPGQHDGVQHDGVQPVEQERDRREYQQEDQQRERYPCGTPMDVSVVDRVAAVLPPTRHQHHDHHHHHAERACLFEPLTQHTPDVAPPEPEPQQQSQIEPQQPQQPQQPPPPKTTYTSADGRFRVNKDLKQLFRFGSSSSGSGVNNSARADHQNDGDNDDDHGRQDHQDDQDDDGDFRLELEDVQPPPAEPFVLSFEDDDFATTMTKEVQVKAKVEAEAKAAVTMTTAILPGARTAPSTTTTTTISLPSLPRDDLFLADRFKDPAVPLFFPHLSTSLSTSLSSSLQPPLSKSQPPSKRSVFSLLVADRPYFIRTDSLESIQQAWEHDRRAFTEDFKKRNKSCLRTRKKTQRSIGGGGGGGHGGGVGANGLGRRRA